MRGRGAAGGARRRGRGTAGGARRRGKGVGGTAGEGSKEKSSVISGTDSRTQ